MEIVNCQIRGPDSQDKPPDSPWFWGETDKKATSRPDMLWPEMQEKQKWVSKNQSSMMPEDCVVFISKQQCLVKLQHTAAVKPAEVLGNTRPKVDESLRVRLEGVPKRNHATGITFTESLQFGDQVYSTESSIIITGCIGNSLENPGMAADKSQKQN